MISLIACRYALCLFKESWVQGMYVFGYGRTQLLFDNQRVLGRLRLKKKVGSNYYMGRKEGFAYEFYFAQIKRWWVRGKDACFINTWWAQLTNLLSARKLNHLVAFSSHFRRVFIPTSMFINDSWTSQGRINCNWLSNSSPWQLPNLSNAPLAKLHKHDKTRPYLHQSWRNAS